jgi:hypothetical protein
MWRIFLILTSLIVSSSAAMSQELRIGHLETADDTDINWLFFHCFQKGQVMDCSIFQTLMMRQLSPEKRAEDIQQAMQDNPVKGFTDNFVDMCKKIDQIKATMRQIIQTGKGADGRTIDIRQANDNMPFFDAIGDACANPNATTVRHVFEITTDKKIKTCEVINEFSQAQFKWNESTQSWMTQEGPNGPCGRVTIGNLERDKSNNSGFWLYTEKHITTNPKGEIPMLGACSKFPDLTLRYTWRATENFKGCTYIVNKMN